MLAAHLKAQIREKLFQVLERTSFVVFNASSAKKAAVISRDERNFDVMDAALFGRKLPLEVFLIFFFHLNSNFFFTQRSKALLSNFDPRMG